MEDIRCGKRFSIYHNDYATCGTANRFGKVYQCRECAAKEKILSNPLVDSMKNCANCLHCLVKTYDKTCYICSNVSNGFTYTNPFEKCKRWELTDVTI